MLAWETWGGGWQPDHTAAALCLCVHLPWQS